MSNVDNIPVKQLDHRDGIGVSMARRRYQRGTLFTRGTREKVWVGRWREDVIAPDGSLKRILRSEVLGTLQELPTRKLALRQLAERLTLVTSPTYKARPTATFAHFAEKWQNTVLSQHKPSTQSSIRSQIRSALVPVFGKLQMKDINPEMVQAFVSRVKHSPKTVKNHIGTLRIMWNSARAWGYVIGDCTEGVILPKSRLTAGFHFSVEELQKILANAFEPYKTFFWLAAETGMRAGELCGLRVEDVDLVNGIVHVHQSIWAGKVQTPKTMNAVRSFAISKELQNRLERLVMQWRPNPFRLLFVSRSGTPLDANNVVKRRLHPILIELGLPLCGLHAFRHANGSLMDRINAPMKIRQQRLGHSDPRLTLGTYTHTVSEDDRKVAGQIGKLLVMPPKQLFPSCSQVQKQMPPLAAVALN